jgi:hypothetical protein
MHGTLLESRALTPGCDLKRALVASMLEWIDAGQLGEFSSTAGTFFCTLGLQRRMISITPSDPATLTLGSCHLFLVLVLVLLFISVVIFGMTQLILIVDLELLGSFGALVDRAHGCLILIRMFIVSVIVVIFGAACRVRAENQSLKLAQGG